MIPVSLHPDPQINVQRASKATSVKATMSGVSKTAKIL